MQDDFDLDLLLQELGYDESGNDAKPVSPKPAPARPAAPNPAPKAAPAADTGADAPVRRNAQQSVRPKTPTAQSTNSYPEAASESRVPGASQQTAARAPERTAEREARPRQRVQQNTERTERRTGNDAEAPARRTPRSAQPSAERETPRADKAAQRAPQRASERPAAPDDEAAPAVSDPRELARERRMKQQQEQKVKRSAMLKTMPFLVMLTAITLLAWALPLRPTVSESEKRALKTFPEFSVSDLVSGTYFSEIDSWFSDTFTFRESWVKATQSFKSHYGIQTVAIYGEVPTNDAVPTVVPTPVPETEATPAPAATPEPTPEVTPEPEQTTEEASDDLPEEEKVWGGQVIEADEFVGNTTVLQIGDSTYNYPAFNQYCSEQYAETMNKCADLLEGKAKVYSVLIPENAAYMLTRADREKYGFVCEEDSLAYIYSLMNDNVGKVNIIDNLISHNDEYLAFRTDHHWTALGAYYAYETWCEVAGVEPVPLSEYTEVVWEGFLGSYYYFAEQSKLLSENPDTVYAYVPPGDVHLYLDSTNRDWLGVESDILIDRSKCQPGAKYMTFLGDDNSKFTFINESIDDDSACVIYKTSFGNPFVYYFTQHYHTVYVLDLRAYSYRSVTSFVDEFNCSAVIFAHGTGLIMDTNGLSIVQRFVK